MTIKIDKNEGDEKLNRKLKRVLDDIRKTEDKITVWQEHLDELNVQKEFLENEEIIKSIRAMKLDSYTLLETLHGVQNGTVVFSHSGKEDSGENAETDHADIESRYADGSLENEIPTDMLDADIGMDNMGLSEEMDEENSLPHSWAEKQEENRIEK